MKKAQNHNEGEIKFTKIKNGSIKTWILIFIFVIVFSSIFGTLSGDYIASKKFEEFKNSFTPENNSSSQTSTIESIPTNIYVDALRKVNPAIVAIGNSAEAFKGDLKTRTTVTGISYRSDGYIITNYHLVKPFDKLFIKKLSSHESVPIVGELKWHNEDYDIAVIKITDEEINLYPAEFGDSDEMGPGDIAISIASPYGDSNLTISDGLINSLGRITSNQKTIPVFQTSSALGVKNDGGPLCNKNGQIIGINNFFLKGDFEPTETTKTSYALTSKIVKKVVDDLIEFGKIVEPQLGLNGSTADPTKNNGIAGVLINEVFVGSGAQEAGLQKGDIITEMNGRSVSNMEEYYDIISTKNAGDILSCRVYRGNETHDFDVKITEAENTN